MRDGYLLLIVLPIRQIGVDIAACGIARRLTITLIFHTFFGLSFGIPLLLIGIVRGSDLPLVSATAGKAGQ